MSGVLAVGIDVGSSAIKAVVVEASTQCGTHEVKAREVQRIRRRDPRAVVADVLETALARAAVHEDDIDYLATTGEGEAVERRRGHFYGMTAHARGALFLAPDVRAALDVGALHARAIRMDDRGRVLEYRMTSQCASGSGQFLENIARYLGTALDEVGSLSLTSTRPEMPSGICAVLAETDVINMVSRGVAAPDILKGIHLSMAGRFVKLLGAARITGAVLLTGGLARDEGLVAALREEAAAQKHGIEFRTHEASPLAGAIGAAIWGAYRHQVLAHRARSPAGRDPSETLRQGA